MRVNLTELCTPIIVEHVESGRSPLASLAWDYNSANAPTLIPVSSYRMPSCSADASCLGTTVAFFENFITGSFGDVSAPFLEKTLPSVLINVTSGSPMSSEPGFPLENVGVRFTGTLKAIHAVGTQPYRIYIHADQNARIKLDGETVLESWTSAFVSTNFSIDMIAGTSRSLAVEFWQTTGRALLYLEWSQPEFPRIRIPTHAYKIASDPCGFVPPPPPSACQGLSASYFYDFPPGASFENRVPETSLVRSQVNFYVDQGQPIVPTIPSFPVVNTGIRYTGRIESFSCSNTCNFWVTADDGFRLWIGDQLLLDKWNTRSPTTFGPVAATFADPALIAIDYFRATGAGVLKLEWEIPGVSPRQIIPATSFSIATQSCGYPTVPPRDPCAGLKTEFFYNFQARSFDGRTADRTLTSSSIDINIPSGFPLLPGMPVESVGVRFTGALVPPFSAGLKRFTFYVSSDDGVRIFFDDLKLVDRWSYGRRNSSFEFTLEGGRNVDLRVEYFQQNATALLKIEWESADFPRSVITSFSLPTTACGYTPPNSTCSGLTGSFYYDFLVSSSFADLTPNLIAPVANLDLVNPFSSEPNFPLEKFGARFTGLLKPYHSSGNALYGFWITNDDRVRVRINDVLVYEDWPKSSSRLGSGFFSVSLPAAALADLVVEFQQSSSGARLLLEWSIDGILPRAIIASRFFAPAKAECGWIAPVPSPCEGITASYFYNFTNRNFDYRVPDLVLQRSTIMFQVDEAHPIIPNVPGFPLNHVGAKFTGMIVPIASLGIQTYTFYLTVDDGARVYIRESLVLDVWDQPRPAAPTFTYTLDPAQNYTLLIDYFEFNASSTLQLAWEIPGVLSRRDLASENFSPAKEECGYVAPSPPTSPNPPTALPPCTGLLASFWFNMTSTASLPERPSNYSTFVSNINFDVGNGPIVSDVPNFPVDYLAVKYEGYLNLSNVESMIYTFYYTADSTGRVVLNGVKVLELGDTGPTPRTGSVSLALSSAQVNSIIVEYYEFTGRATATLEWSSVDAGIPRQIVPPAKLVSCAPPTAPAAPPVATPVTPPIAPPITSPVAPPAAPVAAPVAAPTGAPVLPPIASPIAAPAASPVAAPNSPPVTAPIDPPVAAPVSPPAAAPVSAPTATPVFVAPATAPVSPPIGAPVAAPTATPVFSPVFPPVASPAAAPSPVASPTSPPVTAPIDPPVAAPVSPPAVAPVTAPISAPAAPPVASPVSPPVTAPISVPVAVPISPPVSAPMSPPAVAPTSPPVTSPPPVSPPVAPPVAPGSCGSFYFELYQNMDFSGIPPVRGIDNHDAAYDFSQQSPFPGGQMYGWSGRWSSCILSPVSSQDVSASLKFAADDGLRVWIGGELAANFFYPTAESNAIPVTLKASGCLPITLEFHQGSVTAAWSMKWTYSVGGVSAIDAVVPAGFLRASQCLVDSDLESSCQGLKAEYYPNALSPRTAENLVLAVESPLSKGAYTGHHAYPDAVMAANTQFYVTWSGFLIPSHTSGTRNYRLSAWSRSGAILYLSGAGVSLSFNTMRPPQAPFSSQTAYVSLQAGVRYALKIEWSDFVADGLFGLFWQLEGEEPKLIASRYLQQARSCPIPEAPACSGVYAEYFSGQFFAAQPAARAIEPSLNFDYSVRTPISSNPIADWSGRFHGCIRNPRGSLGNTAAVVHIKSNDGFRFWIRDEIAADTWMSPNSNEQDVSVMIYAGKCTPFVIEMRRQSTGGFFRLGWTVEVPELSIFYQRSAIPTEFLESPVCTIEPDRNCRGLKAEYYAQPAALTQPTVVQESLILFRSAPDWPTLAPAVDGSFPRDQFAIIYRGFLRPKHSSGSKTYTFSAYCDDRCTFKMNGVVFWSNVFLRAPSVSFDMDASQVYEIEFYFMEHGDVASVALSWALPNEDLSIIPPVYFQTSNPKCGSFLPVPVPACSGLFVQIVVCVFWQCPF